MSRHICGAASISNDEASMVVTILEAGRFFGSNVNSESKRLKRVVYVEKPMWLARRIKLAWDLSSLYSPPGGAATGAIAGAPADSAANENPLCRPSAATTIPAARMPGSTRLVRFPHWPQRTAGELEWTVIRVLLVVVVNVRICGAPSAPVTCSGNRRVRGSKIDPPDHQFS